MSTMTTIPTAIIAGCPRSGSTSLFHMLTASPRIAHSRIKEPGFLLDPPTHREDLLKAYQEIFVDRPGAQYRLEASAIYFYNVPSVPSVIRQHLPDSKIILIFRDPYQRLVSELRYLKSRFLLPADLTLAAYVDECCRISEADALKEEYNHLLGVRNGLYDRFFPEWVSAFGDQLYVVFYDDLASDAQAVASGLTRWLGVESVPAESTAPQNQGVSYRSAGIQRAAVGINDRLEPFFRRHVTLKSRLRSIYYRLNGAPRENVDDLPMDHPVRATFDQSVRDFRLQVLEWNPSQPLPQWLAEPTVAMS